MPDTLTDSIKKIMHQALKETVFPGAAVLVSQNRTILFNEAFGVADTGANEEMTLHTFFDLASLTKPLATTLAVMKLVQDKRLDLDAGLGGLILDFKKTDKKDIQIKHLLCHTSGLVDYVPYYKELKGDTADHRKKALRTRLLEAPMVNPVGKFVLYSDLGFMILNWVVETVTQKRLDRFLAETIYGPMGMGISNGLFYNDLAMGSRQVPYAATEYCIWRNKLIKGQVHDENAYAVGGIDGHAGLFGTIAATHDLLSALLAIYHEELASPVFSFHTMKQFLTEQKDTRRTLGFDMPSEKESSAGSYFSKNSVGHLGFTGTSFWMDLDRSIIVVLFTNRVHPSRENEKIRSFRPRFHDAVMKLIR